MKRIALLIIALMLCLSLSACESPGTTNHAIINYGHSNIFTHAEIKSAVKVVFKEFKTFKGCDLLRVRYDEQSTNREYEAAQSNAYSSYRGIKRENLMVLRSDFYVLSPGKTTGLNPFSAYENWGWILIRESVNDPWVVYSYGYG